MSLERFEDRADFQEVESRQDNRQSNSQQSRGNTANTQKLTWYKTKWP